MCDIHTIVRLSVAIEASRQRPIGYAEAREELLRVGAFVGSLPFAGVAGPAQPSMRAQEANHFDR